MQVPLHVHGFIISQRAPALTGVCIGEARVVFAHPTPGRALPRQPIDVGGAKGILIELRRLLLPGAAQGFAPELEIILLLKTAVLPAGHIDGHIHAVAGQAQPFDLQIRCVQADGFQIRAADSIQSVLIEQDLDSGPGKGRLFCQGGRRRVDPVIVGHGRSAQCAQACPFGYRLRFSHL
ncbi:MAG: hypothetical protein BWY83_03162 [bacterium ADurb.Bin478]|nr:MAG: hypothetical protein BWY83_03162 [bacterium ADurb.Bin478]